MSTRLIESDGDAIVIDLDHTLICSKKEYIADVPVIDFPDTRYYVHVRPGVKSFIDYLLKQDYTIIVWSAGLREYVDKIVDIIFGDDVNSRPDMIWCREHCLYINDTHVKPLDAIDRTGRYDSVTIIDDSDYAIDPSDTHRWIKIPRFYGDPNDNVLEALKPLF
jgi:TFIIF-interacting CTD phosphatase-like protein